MGLWERSGGENNIFKGVLGAFQGISGKLQDISGDVLGGPSGFYDHSGCFRELEGF